MKKASPALGADPRVRDEEGPRSDDGATSLHPAPIRGATARDASRIRLVAELARGGMGNVYLAVARGLGGFNKLVAIKELKPEFVDDEAYVAMFLEEARLAARLCHPNIVQTNEVVSEGDRHFMVMEYLEGRSLDRLTRRLSRVGGFPVGAHLRVVGDVLQALDYAHRLRGLGGEDIEIVHRDVSPPNVVVTFDGRTKLLDFGVAKATDSQLETQSGVLKGRVAYMAPEQARGVPVDRRADIYSAGVMIWEAVAGRRLWPEKTNVEVLLHLLNESPPRLRDVRPDVPADLDALCARALAHDREERFPTAAAMSDALQEHLQQRRDLLPPREMGALVARAFQEETQRLRVLVDEALAGAAPADRVPSLLGPMVSTGTFSIGRRDFAGEPTGSSRLSAGPPVASPVPVLPAAAPMRPPPPPMPALARPSRTLAPPTLSEAPPPPPRVPSWLVPAAVAMAIGASLAVIAGNSHVRWVGYDGVGGVAPTTAASVEPGAGQAVMLPLIETIDLDVRVVPRWAQITVDDIEAPSNPFHARLRRDGKPHRIVARADGFDPKTEDVVFSGDVALDLALDRRPVSPPRRPPPAVRPSRPVADALRGMAAAGGSPAPTPRAEPAPVEVLPGQRPIVTANPYGAP
jgi:serine/threonine-protein kinase